MNENAELVIREHADAILWQLVTELVEHYDAIVELAVTRATTIGIAEYGNSSFSKTPKELRTDRFEEHADAVFYAAVERHTTTRE